MSSVPKMVELRHQGFKRAVERAHKAEIEAHADFLPLDALPLTVFAEQLWAVVEDLAHEPCGSATPKDPKDCRYKGVVPQCLSCRARTLVGWPL